MSEKASVIAYQKHQEAAQKFDYFITGLTGALCAYIVKDWKPEKIDHFGPEVLQVAALLILFASAIAGFKRLEWVNISLGKNHEWLDASESRGALAEALQGGGGRIGVNAAGDIVSSDSLLPRYNALTNLTPAIKAQLDKAADKAGQWYKWRNRLLFVGFALLLASRVTVLIWGH